MNGRQKREKGIILLKNIITVFAVFSMVIVLIFLIQGWIIDFNDGKVIQTGLVQFDTNIDGSTVEVGDKTLPEKTTTKTQLKPGEYEFKMWFKDYELWYKKASVKSGEVLWLNYARLIPKDRKVSTHSKFENLKQIKFSKNREKALVVNEDINGVMKMWLINLGETPKVLEIQIPDRLFASDLNNDNSSLLKISENITIEELNENATRAILKWKNNDKNNWIAFDLVDSSKSINLTESFGVNFLKISPKNKNHSRLYVLSDENLREVDLNAHTISDNLLSGVVDIDVFNDEISAFVQKSSDQRYAVGVFKDGRQTLNIARDFDLQPKIKIGNYYNENYIHILTDKKLKIFKGQDWFGDKSLKKYKEISVNGEISDFSLNENNRILKINSDSNTTMFDLETKTKYEIDAEGFGWLDSFILFNFENGKMVMRDFDGLNKYSIFSPESKFDISLSKDEKYIYGIKNKGSDSYLIRVKMII